MYVKQRTVSRKVKLLQDPTPNYVSIVGHGANQTPFKVVKRAQPAKDAKSATGASNMALRPVTLPKAKAVKGDETKDTTKVVAGSAQILKLEFDQDVFKTEKAVSDWLESHDWEGYEITDNEKDGLYEVRSNVVSKADLTDVKETIIETGLAGFTGKLKAESVEKVAKAMDGSAENGTGGSVVNQTGKDKKKDKTVKGDNDGTEDGEQESVIKLDWWEMYQSKGESVTDVLKDGMCDGMPPGMDSIMSATMYAVKNVLTSKDDSAGKQTKLASVGAEMASVLHTVYDLYEGANGLTRKNSTEDTKAFVEAFETQLEAITEPNELSIVEEVELATKAEDEEDDEKDKNKNKPKDKAKKAADAEAPDLAATLAAALGKVMEPVAKGLKDLRTEVAKGTLASKDAATASREAVSKAEEYGNRAPARKSVDDVEERDEAPTPRRDNPGYNNLSALFGVPR